jgi:glutathione synthase/RimK-type ligase-like ATP-grasp enzyme
MAAKTTLILGTSDDEHALHVRERLAARGQRAILLDSRWFPTEMTVALDPQTGGGTLQLPAGDRVKLTEIHAVYWRSYAGVGGPALPDLEQAWIAENDSRSLFESLLIELPARWVNGWQAFQLHQTKPVQLMRVARLGASVPKTLLANDPAAVQDFVRRHAACVVKPVQGGDHTVRLTARELTPEKLANLQYAPITLQAEIPGTNVRVFVAGERVLACEINSATLDYRADDEPALIVHALPAEIAALSRRIARELALLWTGIDFRLTPDGQYVFLEANPSPMFLGFEEATGLPLTEGLLELLLAD